MTKQAEGWSTEFTSASHYPILDLSVNGPHLWERAFCGQSLLSKRLCRVAKMYVMLKDQVQQIRLNLEGKTQGLPFRRGLLA